jgi:GNAT superfamily N-acetyltransferase
MIEVRRPGPADWAGLFAVARPWPTEQGSIVMPWDEVGNEDLTSPPRHLDEPDYCIRVAVDGDEVLGYIAGLHRGRVANLEELMVLESHHRRGAGTLLVQAFERWARDAGCAMVTLGGAVPAFYLKLGYLQRWPGGFVKRLE